MWTRFALRKVGLLLAAWLGLTGGALEGCPARPPAPPAADTAPRTVPKLRHRRFDDPVRFNDIGRLPEERSTWESRWRLSQLPAPRPKPVAAPSQPGCGGSGTRQEVPR